MIGKLPTDILVRTIQNRARPFSVDRLIDEHSTEIGGDENYETDAATADLYVYQPTERPQYVPEGERQAGSLEGLCLPDEDIEHDDRIEYAGAVWEVEAMPPIVVGGETLAHRLSFDRTH